MGATLDQHTKKMDEYIQYAKFLTMVYQTLTEKQAMVKAPPIMEITRISSLHFWD